MLGRNRMIMMMLLRVKMETAGDERNRNDVKEKETGGETDEQTVD